jgi:hypothetical protein
MFRRGRSAEPDGGAGADERTSDLAPVSPVDAVQIQILNRRVNEQTRELLWAADEVKHEFVCECAKATCIERLELTVAEYEEVRSFAARFVLRPGHELQGEEDAVAGIGDGYVVVEKLGEGRSLALWNDPRAPSD